MVRNQTVCSHCLGKGTVESYVAEAGSTPGSYTMIPKTTKCSVCNGLGYVESIVIPAEDFLQLMVDVSFLASALYEIAGSHIAIDDDELRQLGDIRDRWSNVDD